MNLMPYTPPDIKDAPDASTPLNQANLEAWLLDAASYTEKKVNAKGDLLVGTAADTLARVAVGAEGTVPVSRAAATSGIAWEMPAGGGGGILATIVDAKGDLIAATAADTVARHAVGTNGQLLIADPAQATGLRWGTNAADARNIAARPGVAETFSRDGNTMANGNALTLGTLRLSGFMIFRAGGAATNLGCWSGTTAAGTPTNQWFCVVRASDMTVLAVTADDTTAAWGATSEKLLPIAGGPWTPTQDEVCYFGVLVAGTTAPSMSGASAGTLAVSGRAPVIYGNSTTGLTTPLTVGTVVAAPTAAVTHNIWGFAT